MIYEFLDSIITISLCLCISVCSEMIQIYERNNIYNSLYTIHLTYPV